MAQCTEYWVATCCAVVYYNWAARTLSAEIKCRHCRFAQYIYIVNKFFISNHDEYQNNISHSNKKITCSDMWNISMAIYTN